MAPIVPRGSDGHQEKWNGPERTKRAVERSGRCCGPGEPPPDQGVLSSSSTDTLGDSSGVSGESWPGGESSGDCWGESADSPSGDVGSSGVSSTGAAVSPDVVTSPAVVSICVVVVASSNRTPSSLSSSSPLAGRAPTAPSAAATTLALAILHLVGCMALSSSSGAGVRRVPRHGDQGEAGPACPPPR